MNESADIPSVLTIAGSDPSGGAGIQADLKAFVTTGSYGAAVITGLTAQNTCEVSATLPVSPEFVRQQIQSVISDLRIDVIKLGMLTSRRICEYIAPFLKEYTVVCDPVMISTTGYQLIDEDTADAVESFVIPESDYITPNLFELEKLCGRKAEDPGKAGLQLMEHFPGLSGIIVKGGHINENQPEVSDILIYRKNGKLKEKVETSTRYRTANTHGTGCTFASAFASFLARKNSPEEAFSKAVSYTNSLIRISAHSKIGHGRGPLMHHMVSG